MRNRLYKRIFLNFVLVIALFGVLGAALGAVLINRYTLSEAQRRVSLDLRSAWSVVGAKEIVTKHGGRIWAESQAGQGARFSFALPA